MLRTSSFITLWALFFGFSANDAYATVMTFQEGDGGLYSQFSGTHIDSGLPDSNLGSDAYLRMTNPSDSL